VAAPVHGYRTSMAANGDSTNELSRCRRWTRYRGRGNARYRSRPISVRDSRPSFSAIRQRRIKYATSRASKCFAAALFGSTRSG
jgi:hypothetical protein